MEKVNKLISFMLCMVMILALSATAFAFDIPNGSSIPMKASENVNFRSGPGTNYDSFGILNSGEQFNANDDAHSPWYGGYPGTSTKLYQYYGPIKGYVHSDYLTAL